MGDRDPARTDVLDLGPDLTRDLLDGEAARQRAHPDGSCREKPTARPDEPGNLLRRRERALTTVSRQREVNAEAELRVGPGKLDRSVGGGHVRHDRGARQRSTLEALDRRLDGVGRAAEVVRIQDNPHTRARAGSLQERQRLGSRPLMATQPLTVGS
jgi:hypothetical protein